MYNETVTRSKWPIFHRFSTVFDVLTTNTSPLDPVFMYAPMSRHKNSDKAVIPRAQDIFLVLQTLASGDTGLRWILREKKDWNLRYDDRSGLHNSRVFYVQAHNPQTEGLCIKLGRGHWDAYVGTWDLGTRGEGRGDIKYGTRGRVGRGRGDVKYRDTGGKVWGKCNISFFVKMCYLWSTLDPIVQNHIRHLMMFAQNISLQ